MKISENPTFENRYDGGVRLADKLKAYKGRSDVIVLAIPNGGVPVAAPVAFALECPLDFVICRKLPIPLRPEGGFGAVADDGSYILYPEMVRAFGITEEQADQQVHKVRQDVRERILRFRAGRPMPVLNGKTIIVIDDGLASGYTMLAAIESLRRRRPKEIIAAAPTASAPAVKLLEKTADKVVSVVTDFTPSFYVSRYYHFWHNMEDDETMRCI
ncbi:MAG: phosphoribosyl transferase [Chloroflexi bacterium]|nr:phosphoribosyl transferase [Chloroflexota bacterium]